MNQPTISTTENDSYNDDYDEGIDYESEHSDEGIEYGSEHDEHLSESEEEEEEEESLKSWSWLGEMFHEMKTPIIIIIISIMISVSLTMIVFYQFEPDYTMDLLHSIQTSIASSVIVTHSLHFLFFIRELVLSFYYYMRLLQHDFKYKMTTPHIYTLNIPPQCIQPSHLSSSSSINTHTKLECRNLLSDEIINAFHHDGVIAIRGLLSPDLLQGLDQSSMALVQKELQKNVYNGIGGFLGGSGKQFFTSKVGVAFLLDPEDENDNSDSDSSNEQGKKAQETTTQKMDPSYSLSGFRNVALNSILPQIASELMGMTLPSSTPTGASSNDQDSPSVHLLSDIFLVKDDEQYICGWHVDDFGYWPATPESNGINAWIAIDDMPRHKGGGFALSVGSHQLENKPWIQKAHEIIGSTMTSPPEGFKDVQDMFQNRKGSGTCNLKQNAEEIHNLLEENMRIYDVQAGDVIFHTRWLFHRTVPLRWEYVREYRKSRQMHVAQPVKPILKRRYSIRYAPGDSVLPKGFGTELSSLYNSYNQGKKIQQVNRDDGPWFPQCWPNTPSESDLEEVKTLIQTKLPVAEQLRKKVHQEMKPYLQEIGMKNHHRGFNGVSYGDSTTSSSSSQKQKEKNHHPGNSSRQMRAEDIVDSEEL